MIYQQFRDLAPVFGLLTNGFVLGEKSGRKGFCRANPPLSNNALVERHMPEKSLPLAARVRQLLAYNAETGALTWLPRGDAWFDGRYAGTPAFTTSDGHGYLQGKIFGVSAKAHRVVWAHQTGEWPEHQIDHINGNRSDNRICNLRAVTQAENSLNRKRYASNKSGVTGVAWYPRDQVWYATISIGGKLKHLGSSPVLEVAVELRRAAEKQLGFHPNHGRTCDA